jgi:hypothetical protein
MSWEQIDKASGSPEAALKRKAEFRQKTIELARAYSRCFASEDGQRVLSDLTSRFIYSNDTPFDSPNVNYEASYHNGEAGVVKFVINQIQQAKSE